ncbi:MAG TPA: type IX secretion system protein PorQ [Bacteroidales bacterium]|nr:type IX secretion system protein PorQ [Bacteroidales bacterium]
MKRKTLTLLFFLSIFTAGYSQIGGSYTYAFLNQANSARVAALGGKSIAIPDADLNLPFHNPSLLSPEMHNNLVLNYVGYFDDIKYGYVSYARSYGKLGNFAAGIHYVNYGTFPYADENGVRNGNTFTASEYAMNLIYSRPIDTFLTVGINVKPVYSVFESYSSIGIAADLGVTYHNPTSLFTAAVVLRNIGTQITTYYGTAEREHLPFEIQAGLSQKLAHAPFRFSLLFQQLQHWDMTYESSLDNSNVYNTLSNDAPPASKIETFGDNLMRHTIFGLEFMPGKNFFLGFGYNYQRRQELKIAPRVGMVGFSWGFGLKISKFQFSYGRATYHLAGASNHFSLSTNLSEFYRKN